MVTYQITEHGKKMVEDPSNWGDVPPEKLELVRKIIDEYAKNRLVEGEPESPDKPDERNKVHKAKARAEQDKKDERAFYLNNPEFLEIT